MSRNPSGPRGNVLVHRVPINSTSMGLFFPLWRRHSNAFSKRFAARALDHRNPCRPGKLIALQASSRYFQFKTNSEQLTTPRPFHHVRTCFRTPNRNLAGTPTGEPKHKPKCAPSRVFCGIESVSLASHNQGCAVHLPPAPVNHVLDLIPHGPGNQCARNADFGAFRTPPPRAKRAMVMGGRPPRRPSFPAAFINGCQTAPGTAPWGCACDNTLPCDPRPGPKPVVLP